MGGGSLVGLACGSEHGRVAKYEGEGRQRHGDGNDRARTPEQGGFHGNSSRNQGNSRKILCIVK